MAVGTHSAELWLLDTCMSGHNVGTNTAKLGHLGNMQEKNLHGVRPLFRTVIYTPEVIFVSF